MGTVSLYIMCQFSCYYWYVKFELKDKSLYKKTIFERRRSFVCSPISLSIFFDMFLIQLLKPFILFLADVHKYTTSAPVLPLRRTYVRFTGVTVILIRISVVFIPLDKINYKINNLIIIII